MPVRNIVVEKNSIRESKSTPESNNTPESSNTPESNSIPGDLDSFMVCKLALLAHTHLEYGMIYLLYRF